MPWRLLLANLMAHKLRALLTVASLAIATFLLVFLRTVLVALEAPVQASASNRLMVQSAVSLFVDLPTSYQQKIDAMKGPGGVKESCKFQWFGGIYRDPSNFFAQFGIDADRLLTVYPEIELVDGSIEELQRRRSGCIVGVDLAREFQWKVGDRIPLIGTIFPKGDGGAWEFDLVGIYRSKRSNVDNRTMYFRWDYLDETLRAGQATGPDGVGVYAVALEPGASVESVAARIDRELDTPQRVQATTEAEFQRQFVSMLGSVPTFLTSIGGGVLFAILFAVLNTMLMAARERTHDLGILKALGFGDAVAASLLMLESLALCAAGGVLGVVGMFALRGPLAEMLSMFVPAFHITGETALIALGLALAIGVVAGLIPAWQASQLRPVQALRAEV